MTTDNKEILINRFKGFLWHSGAMIAPFAVDFTATNINLFNLPNWMVVTVGLLLAQVTKYLNTKKA